VKPIDSDFERWHFRLTKVPHPWPADLASFEVPQTHLVLVADVVPRRVLLVEPAQ
jgi:hypothetical protein